MKEFFKRLDRETLFGGIFGVIAIVAIIVEMILAGISAESGLATFRSEDGLWNKHRIEDVATIEAYYKNQD